MSKLQIDAMVQTRPLVRPFIIATGARTHQPVLSVTVSDGHYTGRGEATGVRYRGETVEAMQTRIEALSLRRDVARNELMELLPAGGARFALDSALWELEAARSGISVARQLGIDPAPVESAFTIVLDTPEAMSAQTREEAWRPLLKVKLGASDRLEADRIRAVRAAAPDARLVIDANAAWTPAQLLDLAPVARSVGYELIEQPLPMYGEEDPAVRDALKAARAILPICADESFQTRDDLGRCVGLYDFINIKLDKCGGLTAALAIREAAQAADLGLFVGCMVAPAIAIAPAHLLAQMSDYADLDGPFWFADEPVTLNETGLFNPVSETVWGQGGQHAQD